MVYTWLVGLDSEVVIARLVCRAFKLVHRGARCIDERDAEDDMLNGG
jgi:hypothetical protein